MRALTGARTMRHKQRVLLGVVPPPLRRVTTTCVHVVVRACTCTCVWQHTAKDSKKKRRKQ